VWSDRLAHGPRSRQATAALLAVARELGLWEAAGAGLLEVPAGTNARGLREVGCAPNLLPGLAERPEPGRDAAGIAAGLAGGELDALVLLRSDPVRTYPDRGRWEEALEEAGFVVSITDFLTESAERADVVLPAEAWAEREGTLTHPDGRVQRVRQSIGYPGQVRPAWGVLAELHARLRSDLEALTAPMVTARVAESVPFYAGLTLEEIGGRGVRWQERDAAGAAPEATLPEEPPETPPELGTGLRLGTHSSLWADPYVRHSPVLRFLRPEQVAELAAADAARLGVGHGDRVEVAVNGTSVRARAALRAAQPPGSVFLLEDTAGEDDGNALSDGTARVAEVRKA
jgi:NADH-quinone oxidoreductase subunit G